jgi:chlorite dismutase
VRRFLIVTLCYKVSIIPCYLQEVLMRKSLTRQRVAQFKLFHPPQKRPSWWLLPPEVRGKVERLLARLLREHIGRVHVSGSKMGAGDE